MQKYSGLTTADVCGGVISLTVCVIVSLRQGTVNSHCLTIVTVSQSTPDSKYVGSWNVIHLDTSNIYNLLETFQKVDKDSVHANNTSSLSSIQNSHQIKVLLSLLTSPSCQLTTKA